MIARACALALVGAVMSYLLGEIGFRSKRLFATLCILLLLIGMYEPLSKLFLGLDRLSHAAGITDATSSALRAVGLGYVFSFTSDVCREMGEGGIATAVTVVGRIEIFLVAYPYFEKTVNLVMELMQ